MLPIVKTLANRMKEPSSWTVLAGAAAAAGVNLDPGLAQSLAYIGAGVAGVVAFFLPERK